MPGSGPRLTSERRRIAHLIRRAGFGASPAEMEHYMSLGYNGALSELLNPTSVDDSLLESLISRQSFDFTRLEDLKRWWIYRMAFSRRPLEEKMTLFWHGHFATANAKVKSAYAMYVQNMLLRRHCLGDFQQMLADVSRDPAMIMWLDNQQNRRGRPNENYAREIMELFTMGIGNYSESDVKEAARAFTGWQVRPGGFAFNSFQHDHARKTVLGVSGYLNGNDVVSILVRQKATAINLARKLCKFFVSEEPEESMVKAAADAYLAGNYRIKPVVEAIFTHPAFLSERAFHAKVKSPAELVVGAVKALSVTSLPYDLPKTMAKMGQNLFEPPSVKGWDGGPAWISTDSMMERFNFAASISGQQFDEVESFFSPSELVHRENLRTAGQVVDYFLDMLVDSDVPAPARARLVGYFSSDLSGARVTQIEDDTVLDTRLRGLVRLIMSLPTYQLA